jgi:hypothetical protein
MPIRYRTAAVSPNDADIGKYPGYPSTKYGEIKYDISW